jgi:2-oxoglutarate ferredoxin oxidoreductase subunit beta
MDNKWLTTTDFIWCAGCPANWLAVTLAQLFEELELDRENSWMVSGIGCTGRIANYFTCSTAHTTHGRAVPVAEGIKTAKPKKDVFVVSGDGDLLSIGLNHLIHAARRNINLKVICVNNQLFGMTGGQTSPTTALKSPTKTHPLGSPYQPLAPAKLFKAFPQAHFAELKVYDEKFKEAFIQAYNHDGFSFINLISFCKTNDPRFKNEQD